MKTVQQTSLKINNRTPKISVVLPTYNGAKFLSASISSLINQTEKDWELIIVNDCSKDNTLEIANNFAAKDRRISVYTNESNKKLPASLNVGFAKAQGKYLTWTSDDNLYKPDALKMMSEYLDRHPKTDMVSMNMDIIEETGEIFQPDLYSKQQYHRCAAELLDHCNVGAAFMYRRSIAQKVGDYDTFTFCAEDYDYWCRIALQGVIDYTDDNIYQYRKNSQSLSATKQKQISEKTLYIKKKYAEQFFSKFHYTEKDKALFWFNSMKKDRPKQYGRYYLAWLTYKHLVKILVLPLFWDAELRKTLKNKLMNTKNYSFQKARK